MKKMIKNENLVPPEESFKKEQLKALARKITFQIVSQYLSRDMLSCL
jgi:hypothetical protein